MLIKFKVSNYLSFKEGAILDMVPAAIKEYDEENISTPLSHVSVLKSAVFYGANSSGKSNFLKAMGFVKRFILESSKDKQVNEKIDVENFKLSSDTDNRPCVFELEFLHEEIKYRYGFKVDCDKVYEEWLFYTKKLKEHTYFERVGNDYKIDEKFEGAKELATKTRENALFLSVVAQFNGAIAVHIINWIQKIKFIHDFNQAINTINFTASQLEEGNPLNNAILKLLSAADLGFNEVKAEKIQITDSMVKGLPKEIKEMITKQDHTIISTIHNKYDSNNNKIGDPVYFNLSKHESLGTQKYFSMAGHIVSALANGGVLVIDELDSRLHPSLSSLIVKLFNSKTNNKNNAQLICTTHNTNLLSRKTLRRDQVILTHKDDFGATKIKTLLAENVRNDAAFEKNYLEGLYDAVPKSIESLDLFGN